MWHAPWSALCHQGAVYEAGYAALPVLADIAAGRAPGDQFCRPGPAPIGHLGTQPLRRPSPRATLSHMAKYSAELDGVFVALADPTRRAVVRRLGHGPRSVGDLAREFPMTLPSFMKHVRTLESSGLIRTVKSGRVRSCVLNRERLALVDDWLAQQRRIWEERTDRLEQFVTDPEENRQ
ncbi:hypothetical protein GCM10023079_24950 [Streptomyces chitinivorans]